MDDWIIVAIIVLIVAVAIGYMVKAKRSGAKCIGCSVGGCCSHKQDTATSCKCGCGSEESQEASSEH